jgi:hypothetical protein
MSGGNAAKVTNCSIDKLVKLTHMKIEGLAIDPSYLSRVGNLLVAFVDADD